MALSLRFAVPEYREGDLNPYVFQHMVLNHARLPLRHPGTGGVGW